MGYIYDTLILGKGRRHMIDPHVHLRDWNEKETKSGGVAVDFHARPDPDIPSGSEGSGQWK